MAILRSYRICLYRELLRFRMSASRALYNRSLAHRELLLVSNSFARSLLLSAFFYRRIRIVASLCIVFSYLLCCSLHHTNYKIKSPSIWNDKCSGCFNFPIFCLFYLIRNLFLFTSTRYFYSSLCSLLQ